MAKMKYDIINPENEQKLIEEEIEEEDADYEEARKQLTITDKYYDWNNTIADRILNAIEEGRVIEISSDPLKIRFGEEIDEDMIKEYNEAVADFNKYGDGEYINWVKINMNNIEQSKEYKIFLWKEQTNEEIEDIIYRNDGRI